LITSNSAADAIKVVDMDIPFYALCTNFTLSLE